MLRIATGHSGTGPAREVDFAATVTKPLVDKRMTQHVRVNSHANQLSASAYNESYTVRSQFSSPANPQISLGVGSQAYREKTKANPRPLPFGN